MDNLDLALLLLRIGVGLTFAAHGAQKVLGWWEGPGMDGWRGAMAHMGFRPVGLFAALSATTELAGGLLLALGVATPLVAAALLAQSIVIIGHVHLANGFFAAKAGIEFPLILGLAALAVGLVGPGVLSVDAALGLVFEPPVRNLLLTVGVVAGVATLAVPRVARNRPGAGAA